MDNVALLRCEDDFKERLREALELVGGFGSITPPLIVKPNICTGSDSTGYANVKVEAVKALIELALEEDEGLPIRVVESNSMSKYASKAFKRFGLKDMEEEFKTSGLDVSLMNLSESPRSRMEFEGLYFKDPELPTIITEPGYMASVALPKTHSLTMVTGALKNLFGLLPKKNQSYYHQDINEVIIDVNRIANPQLCVIDARVGLEGVISGNPKPIGAIIVGRKPASVDATMARIMGFDPERIRHLVMAQKNGLGSLNPEVIGENIESIAVQFKEPSNPKPTALIN
ncbi:MAG: DUF362 domain-containing protein [Candidatus Bathyarchaeia archaeon]